MSAKRPQLAPWLRIVREPSLYDIPVTTIRSPEDAFRLVEPRLSAEETEVVVALMLDSQSKVRSVAEVSRGDLDSSVVHPRETFRLAVANGAAAIIICHNHPSGDPTPSAADHEVTRRLVAAGDLLGIPLYDHLVVGGPNKFSSFATRGLL